MKAFRHLYKIFFKSVCHSNLGLVKLFSNLSNLKTSKSFFELPLPNFFSTSFCLFSDVRLKKFNEEKQELQVEVQKLQQQLNDVKTRGGRRSSSLNGVLDDDDDFEDAQRKY